MEYSTNKPPISISFRNVNTPLRGVQYAILIFLLLPLQLLASPFDSLEIDEGVMLRGVFTRGGYVIGIAPTNVEVRYEDEVVNLNEYGQFMLGFADSNNSAKLEFYRDGKPLAIKEIMLGEKMEYTPPPEELIKEMELSIDATKLFQVKSHMKAKNNDILGGFNHDWGIMRATNLPPLPILKPRPPQVFPQ